MLASTQTSDYISFLPRPCEGSMSPSCRAAQISTPQRRPSNRPNQYESPILTPSPLQNRYLGSGLADTDDIFFQSPFKSAPMYLGHTSTPINPLSISAGDNKGAKCLTPMPSSPVFFSSSISQPLRTPVKQANRVPSRPVLSIKQLNTVPLPTSSTNTHIGVGTKRKSTTTLSTPLRPKTFTPLNISSAENVDPRSGVAFDRLAPLPAPRFNSRTPQTRAETEGFLKTQTHTMTRLQISDWCEPGQDLAGEDSGCEVGDENDTGDFLFLTLTGKTKKLVWRDRLAEKGKGEKEEIVEAVSPDGHVTKRRARSKPLSLDLLESVQPTSGDMVANKYKGPLGNGNSFPTTPFMQPPMNAEPSSSSEAGSPLPRHRTCTTTKPWNSGPESPQIFTRRPLSRHESSGTLFFGPTIPSPTTAAAPTTRSPPSNVSPFPRPQRVRSEDSGDDEDMFFGGLPESSLALSVTEGTPSLRSRHSGRAGGFTTKYQPRDSGIALSDDEDMGSFDPNESGTTHPVVMPKASTSVGSVRSDGDEGLVTPGAGPSPASGWPDTTVVVNSFFDELTEGMLGRGERGVNADEFVLRALAAGAKGPNEGAKKVPGTPVKRVKTSHLGQDRLWQSAVANKVGLGEGFELGGRKAPRKSLPAAFPVLGGYEKDVAMVDLTGEDSDGEDEEISPTLRKDRYVGLGRGRPAIQAKGMDESTARPRTRWLTRRSSSGVFSSGGESLIETPTGLRGKDWKILPPRVSTPSEDQLKDSPALSTLGSPGSSVLARASLYRSAEDRLGRLEREFVEVDEVGSGEFGNVIKVRSKNGCEGEVFAVKKSKTFEGVRHRMRLREEVEILEHLSKAAAGAGQHPNVLAYIDSWEEDERLFIRTELCELGNFAQFLWEYGRMFPRLDEARVWKIIVDLSNGLGFIHDAGVIHLDLKPANIFVTGEGRFRIGDFGMASIWPRPGGGTFEREGDKLYLAPEVLQGEYGKAADVFSLGMTVLETASNIVVPDQGEPWHRLRQEDFEQVDLDESPELLALIKRMMRTNPALRVEIREVVAHPVVSRARLAMTREYLEAREKGVSVFCSSPLASVSGVFLDEILGRTEDGEGMDI